MYSIVVMTAMSLTGPEATGFGSGSWYNWNTLDMCLPIRYGWKPYGCVPNYVGGYYGGCGCGWGSCCWGAGIGCGGCYGGYGYSFGGFPGYNCFGCYGSGVPYWSLGYAGPSTAGVGYSGLFGYGNYGMYGSYSFPNNYNSPYGFQSYGQGIISNQSPIPGTATPTVDPSSNLSPSPSSNTPSIPVAEPLGKPKQINNFPAIYRNSKATISLDVPEDAKVYIDGHLMKSAKSHREFVSPELKDSENYYYTIRVVVVRNGKTYEETNKIHVRAGEKTIGSFARLGEESLTTSPSFAKANK